MKRKDLIRGVVSFVFGAREHEHGYPLWWGDGIKATKGAKRLAWEGEIDLEDVKHEGEVITAIDIENYLKRAGRFFSRDRYGNLMQIDVTDE